MKYGVQITTASNGKTWSVSQLEQPTPNGAFRRTRPSGYNAIFINRSKPDADTLVLEAIQRGLEGKLRLPK
jgi:hypothetical protein